MDELKQFKIYNKSDKPDNIVKKENDIIELCFKIEKSLPMFMDDFFIYLKNSVSTSTRFSYLCDVRFFCEYLVKETRVTKSDVVKEIAADDFRKVKAKDINHFLDYCSRYKVEKNNQTYIYKNGNRSLSRKKSSLAVLFKFLYRNELLSQNITDGFNPIKLPKPGSKEIKKLAIDEVKKMIDAVENGTGLTEKELEYWQKTKLRDKAILLLFVTYGLRLYELQQLNISAFNFNKSEFIIYRKRDKESLMPINKTVEKVIKDYIKSERSNSESVPPEDQDALFLSLQRKRMTERAIRTLVKKYTSIAMDTGRSFGYSPHKLRATAATSLIEQGHSIYDVKNLLDHDNITTTQLYSAHKKDVKRDLIKNFEWLDEFE